MREYDHHSHRMSLTYHSTTKYVCVCVFTLDFRIFGVTVSEPFVRVSEGDFNHPNHIQFKLKAHRRKNYDKKTVDSVQRVESSK